MWTWLGMIPSNQRFFFLFRENFNYILTVNFEEQKHEHNIVQRWFYPPHLIRDSDHAKAATPTCNLRHKSFTPSEYLNAFSYAQIVYCGRILFLLNFQIAQQYLHVLLVRIMGICKLSLFQRIYLVFDNQPVYSIKKTRAMFYFYKNKAFQPKYCYSLWKTMR